MTYRVITTCNALGWQQYGRRMASTFLQFWPKNIGLTVYAEGFNPDISGISVERLPSWLFQLKRRHFGKDDPHGKTVRGYNYRRDFVKFAHKVAAIVDAGEKTKDGILIWADADIVTHEEVTKDWLDGLFPGDGYMAWLDRKRKYPECGFMMFRCDHPSHRIFMEELRDMYDRDRALALRETHDSFVVEHLVNGLVQRGVIEAPHSLSGDAREFDHPMVAGQIGSRLDHLKGGRKAHRRSYPTDTKGRRKEAYWTR